MFVMLLRGAGVIVYSEVHTHKGRSDVVIQLGKKIIVLEFKFASRSSEIEQKRNEGRQQLLSRDYAKSYEIECRTVIIEVIVADDEKRQVIL